MMKHSSLTAGFVCVAVLMGLGVVFGVRCSGAQDGPEHILLQLKEEDLATYFKVTNLRMCLTDVLNRDALDQISGEGSNARIIQVASWPHAPVEVAAPGTEMKLRVRGEDDFLVIWYRRPIALLGGMPLDIIRQVTGEFLADMYVLGQPDTLIAPGARGNAKSQIKLFEEAKVVEGTTAIACSYEDVSAEQRWKIFSRLHVLLKQNDAIVVLEKSKARQLGVDEYIYEGLEAAKIRLAKGEAERAQGEPILAKNVMFDVETDLGKLSDALLNGCMWPTDNAYAIGTKEVCAAVVLRPAKKYGSTSEDSSEEP